MVHTLPLGFERANIRFFLFLRTISPDYFLETNPAIIKGLSICNKSVCFPARNRPSDNDSFTQADFQH